MLKETLVALQSLPGVCQGGPCAACHKGKSPYLRQTARASFGLTTTLAVLNIVPPEQKNGGSIADDPINLAHLLGMLHIDDLIC
jgi:hypothetical protein